ncbi:hypothetical protein BOX15_Mlig012628g3, partial [Macrostomum lignano]
PETTMAQSLDYHMNKALNGPYNYICQAGGKQIRGKLFKAFNHWLNVSEEVMSVISEIAEMLHNSSLIIDDIEDSSELRRGVPVAHHVFGLPLSLNSACYMYFKALDTALRLPDSRVPRVFTDQMLVLHRGQGLDLYWRDTYTCPTLEQYQEMVRMKTGGLFGLGIRLMCLFSGDCGAARETDLLRMADLLGVFFQVRDDFANLMSEEYHDNKSFCEDLTEGKYSYPIVWAIQNCPDDDQISSVLRQRTRDVEVKKFCVRHLRSLGALDHTVQFLRQLEAQLMQLLDSLSPDNALLRELVLELAKLYANA